VASGGRATAAAQQAGSREANLGWNTKRWRGRSKFIGVSYCTGRRAGKWLAQIRTAERGHES